MKWLAALSAICLMAVAQPVAANTEVHDVWEVFVEHAPGRLGLGADGDWENILYAAARATRTEDAAVAEFGRRIGVDTATAKRYASVVIAAVVFDQESYDNDAEDPPFERGTWLYDLTADVAAREPSGQLLRVVARAVDDRPDAFVRLALPHPRAAELLVDLHNLKDGPYLIGALRVLPADPSAIAPPLLWPHWNDATIESESRILAAAEAAYARMDRTPQTRAWRAALSRYLIAAYAMAGGDAEAVALYRADAALVSLRLDGIADVGRYPPGGDSQLYAPAYAVAAALWHEGDSPAALAVLDGLGEPQTLMTALVRDAISPSIPNADLFTFYLLGRPCDPKQGPCDSEARVDSGVPLMAAEGSPALKVLLAARLTAAGQADIAEGVLAPWLGDFAGHVRGYGDIADLMPEGAAVHVPEWQARLEAHAARPRPEPPLGRVHVTVTALPEPWHEAPLPTGMIPWIETETPPRLPGKSRLPDVGNGFILRHEIRGGDGAVVYGSGRYDVPGEQADNGLWLALRRGGQWQKPVYLGFQQGFPFAVTEGSRLPLIVRDDKGEEHLQLEVRVRDVNSAYADAIVRQGTYLDIPVAAVLRDSDGDGLTDIAEARLGLRPDHRDSDGDGMEDDRDPLPLTAFAPTASEDNAVAQAFLQKLIGYMKGAIVISPDKARGQAPVSGDPVFVVADPALFAGVTGLPVRLFVYSPADIKALGHDGRLSNPPGIRRIYRSLDGKRVFVQWSAKWQGGSFLIDCSGRTCETDDFGGWIS